jgi:trimeric autotransporter adhesin
MRDIALKFTMIVIITSFLLAVIPVSAVKTAEQSVGDSITRGSRFTVTIIGLPNSSYYLWIPHTSSMTGEPHDQPPVISDYQVNVMEDPADGPWPIGSYQYNNGNGQTIRDDIPPSTPDMPNTHYYALVTTDNSGQATVEFRTSVNTGLRSYTVKVENPRSIDSDNLLVELQVYSRKAPAIIEIFTTPQTVLTTFMPTTTNSPLTITILPVTNTQEPTQTTLPIQIPTRKAPLGIGTGILAAVMSLLLMRRH